MIAHVGQGEIAQRGAPEPDRFGLAHRPGFVSQRPLQAIELAIAIRIAVLVPGEIRVHVGGGIVADSDPRAELAETEMYFSVFYGVLDPLAGRLAYANAGHPYAFRVPRFGEPERLESTAPPLGLATAGSIQRRQVPWSVGHDLLALWTDGLVDARNDADEPFGEARLLGIVCRHRNEPVEIIVQAVLDEFETFGAHPADDRTLLILRI